MCNAWRAEARRADARVSNTRKLVTKCHAASNVHAQAEPEPGAPHAATVAVRLPDASVVRRRFSASADTSAVHAWVACLEDFPSLWERATWALVTAFPRARLPPSGATLEEAHVVEGGGALLIVEQL